MPDPTLQALSDADRRRFDVPAVYRARNSSPLLGLRLEACSHGFSASLASSAGRVVYSVNVSSGAGVYIGCFQEASRVGDRGLPVVKGIVTNSAVCKEQCQEWRYYGIQRVGQELECHCGNSYIRYM